MAEALTSWRRSGLEADVEFNQKMGLPGSPSDITLFHYALDGLILDQITVPLDPDADSYEAVNVLVDRIIGGKGSVSD